VWQIVIALLVTPEGLPLAYEVLARQHRGQDDVAAISRAYRTTNTARRAGVWLMDRGVPTEEVLAEMRAADPAVHYLVGTPKGRLTRLRSIWSPSHGKRRDPECRSNCWRGRASSTSWPKAATRVAKERAMRRRRLKRLWRGSSNSPPCSSRARKLLE